jgi:two-component system chemotaxis sensor kinase CheA
VGADAVARMTNFDTFNLIFYTRSFNQNRNNKITDISGRGVSSGVVKTKINQLNGTINIDSNMDVVTTS